jgi:hypothetical protein
MASFLKWQREVVARLPHVRETYALGTSAGAYAALVSGHFLKVSIVWAFAPPARIERQYMRLPVAGCAPDPLDCTDLLQVLRAHNGVTEYRIYFNEAEEADRVAASQLARCPGVRLFPQGGEGHGVVHHLVETNQLVGMMPPFVAV